MIGAFYDDCAWSVEADVTSNVTKGANDFLGEGSVDEVFRRFMEGDAVDVLKVGAYCEVVIGWDNIITSKAWRKKSGPFII